MFRREAERPAGIDSNVRQWTSADWGRLICGRAQLPAFAIAAPDGATAAVTATLAATAAERLIAEGPPDDLLAPEMIVVALATALTGLLLWGPV